jgi:hypothetical protein
VHVGDEHQNKNKHMLEYYRMIRIPNYSTVLFHCIKFLGKTSAFHTLANHQLVDLRLNVPGLKEYGLHNHRGVVAGGSPSGSERFRLEQCIEQLLTRHHNLDDSIAAFSRCSSTPSPIALLHTCGTDTTCQGPFD